MDIKDLREELVNLGKESIPNFTPPPPPKSAFPPPPKFKKIRSNSFIMRLKSQDKKVLNELLEITNSRTQYEKITATHVIKTALRLARKMDYDDFYEACLRTL